MSSEKSENNDCLCPLCDFPVKNSDPGGIGSARDSKKCKKRFIYDK